MHCDSGGSGLTVLETVNARPGEGLYKKRFIVQYNGTRTLLMQLEGTVDG